MTFINFRSRCIRAAKTPTRTRTQAHSNVESGRRRKKARSSHEGKSQEGTRSVIAESDLIRSRSRVKGDSGSIPSRSRAMAQERRSNREEAPIAAKNNQNLNRSAITRNTSVTVLHVPGHETVTTPKAGTVTNRTGNHLAKTLLILQQRTSQIETRTTSEISFIAAVRRMKSTETPENLHLSSEKSRHTKSITESRNRTTQAGDLRRKKSADLPRKTNADH